MNVITLNNDQLAIIKATLQKLRDDLISDMNAGGEWSDTTIDVVNDRYDVITGILREFEDCQTPKVVKRQPPQKPVETPQEDDGFYEIRKVARALNIDSKRFYNRKDTGKITKGIHFKKVGDRFYWNLEALRAYFRSENSH